ncbi:MAG TPA: hypothetical protein VMI92_11785 [Steroidobacteraceae bacterium]|nr:hypothetical protein [Steroidobacteraceae bacterium]
MGRIWQGGLALSIGLWLVLPVAQSQVSQPTEADKAKVPVPFRPDDQQTERKGPAGFAPRGTPEGYTPNPDPRDFTGSYVSGGGGPPPGGAPGGGGPPGAGGPPGGGAPPGGGTPPGGGAQPGAGAPPGGGAPGAGPGGAGAPGGKPSCVPSFDSGAYAIHVVSSPGRLTIVGEENHRIRRVYIGAQLPANPTPAYGGNAVGRWDGNTLVIDTVGIKGRPGVHQRERWTRESNGSIAIEIVTLDASGKASAPQASELVWRPDISFVENICEDFGEAFGTDSGYGVSKQ